MSQGLLDRALINGTVYVVAMDEVKFMAFGENGLTSVGTKDLNACSVVMIVSVYGAILAHIPPNTLEHSSDLDSSDRHAQAKMLEVEALYRANSSYFPLGGNNWILCAVIQGNIALPTHQKIMQDSLKSLGLPYFSPVYVAGRTIRGASSTGTVFIDASGPVPDVYVEDISVSKGATWPSSSASTSYTTGSSAYAAVNYSAKGYSTSKANVSSEYAADTAATWPSSSASTSYTTGPSPHAAVDYSAKDWTSNANVSSGYAADPAATSQTQAGTTLTQGEEESKQAPYYYVQNKQYFYFNGVESVLLSERPKKVWVYNANGWSDSTKGEKWRYWEGGKNIKYS